MTLKVHSWIVTAVLAAIGLGGVVYALIEAQLVGWNNRPVLGSLGFGMCALAAFLVVVVATIISTIGGDLVIIYNNVKAQTATAASCWRSRPTATRGAGSPPSSPHSPNRPRLPAHCAIV